MVSSTAGLFSASSFHLPERVGDAAEAGVRVELDHLAGRARHHRLLHPAGAALHVRGKRIDADARPPELLERLGVRADRAVARADVEEEPVGARPGTS